MCVMVDYMPTHKYISGLLRSQSILVVTEK